jgi:hypothetical protein
MRPPVYGNVTVYDEAAVVCHIAPQVSLRTVAATVGRLQEVHFVLFGAPTFSAYVTQATKLFGPPLESEPEEEEEDDDDVDEGDEEEETGDVAGNRKRRSDGTAVKSKADL